MDTGSDKTKLTHKYGLAGSRVEQEHATDARHGSRLTRPRECDGNAGHSVAARCFTDEGKEPAMMND